MLYRPFAGFILASIPIFITFEVPTEVPCQYESRTRVDYPFSPAGWIFPLIGIVVIIYGVASKPKPVSTGGRMGSG